MESPKGHGDWCNYIRTRQALTRMPLRDDLSPPILKDGKQRGELRFDVAYFPVLKPKVNESGVEELPESSTFRFF